MPVTPTMRAIDRAVAEFENLALDYHRHHLAQHQAWRSRSWNVIRTDLRIEHHKRHIALIRGREE